MAKDRSFAAKLAKAKGVSGQPHCPKCGEAITPIQFVVSERSAVSGAWKFNQRFVGVCKCNSKEILG